MWEIGIVIVMRKEKLHGLITNIIKIFGNEFSLKDLLLSKSLSLNTKKEMNRIFGGDYQSVGSHDFHFENRDGMWTNTHADFNHKYTMKILNSLQKNRTFPVGAEISPGNLELTETLINKLNDILQKESDYPDLYSGFETDREEIDFISKNLSLKFGKTAIVEYHFIKTFMELYHEYDEMILERCVEEMEGD